MKRAPKVGQRVRYYSDNLIEYEKEPRICVGTVMMIYPYRNDALQLMPEEQWSAGVQVDRPLPKWWAYGENDRFAPDVSELEPI